MYSNSSVMNLTTLNLVTVYSNSSVMNLTTLNFITEEFEYTVSLLCIQILLL